MRTLNFFIFSLIAFMAVTSLTACRDKDKSNDEEQPQVIRSNDELKPSAQDVLTAPQQLKSTLNTLTSDVNDGFDERTSHRRDQRLSTLAKQKGKAAQQHLADEEHYSGPITSTRRAR